MKGCWLEGGWHRSVVATDLQDNSADRSIAAVDYWAAADGRGSSAAAGP